MPLGTSWKDIGSLLLYGTMCAGAFFGAALFHWFIIPDLPISPATRTALNWLSVVLLGFVVHLVWGLAFKKAEPSPYRWPKRSAK
jgi:hypothetical protein